MNNENVNFDENDEVTDEQYFSEDNDMSEAIIKANISSEDSYEGSKIDEDAQTADTEFDDDEYRVSRITDTFLKWECSIKNEQSKSEVHFRYRGEEFRGVVLQKLNAQNYVRWSTPSMGLTPEAKVMEKRPSESSFTRVSRPHRTFVSASVIMSASYSTSTVR